ncbi:MAG: CDP-diacylglycerol--glycerol-3-phosphate 3-phosphatidyltransferase [Elusimicrobiota bacterium]|jgi:CDP-diacylglycerol--glycerol-3-phosphate 3-phosphatidyltransferase|nr:CDP-diacylglycerol--glycerol-3-phosphate 3-phosphatidyltransferase [Elusimicrobiota bacterium]
MNFANKLTLTRVLLVPFFIVFIEIGGFALSILALLVFSIASITDFFDGRYARKHNLVTSFGVFLDPLADKLLISSAFICLLDISFLQIPAWMVIAIISREFIITGFRTIAMSKSVVIPADKSGKFKTSFQIVVIIISLFIIIIKEGFLKFYNVNFDMIALFDSGAYGTLAMLLDNIPFWAVLIATVLTIYSGANYIWKYRYLLKDNG